MLTCFQFLTLFFQNLEEVVASQTLKYVRGGHRWSKDSVYLQLDSKCILVRCVNAFSLTSCLVRAVDVIKTAID